LGEKRKEIQKIFMLKVKSLLFAVLIALLLAACSQVAEMPEETPGETPQLGAAASSPYTEVSWYKGEPYRNLISTAQGFCYLAGIQGNFDSDSDQASVFITQGDYGLIGSNTDWAKAICVNWSALKINYNAFEPVRWLSDEFYSIEDCGSQNYADTWLGDAVTYLTGVGGNLAVGGGAFVIQSSKGDKPSQLLSTKNCGSGSVYTRGRSMFFGKPHINDMPQFWGPNAQGKTYPLAGYYYAQSNTQATVEMAPTDKAFCYLQGVNGNYNHSSDWAWIYRSTNSASKEIWKLGVKDSNPINDKFVGATAACYMLGQN
jgi:putative hemolysin